MQKNGSARVVSGNVNEFHNLQTADETVSQLEKMIKMTEI